MHAGATGARRHHSKEVPCQGSNRYFYPAYALVLIPWSQMYCVCCVSVESKE